MHSWTGASVCGVIVILGGIKAAHYLSVTKCGVSSEKGGTGQENEVLWVYLLLLNTSISMAQDGRLQSGACDFSQLWG